MPPQPSASTLALPNFSSSRRAAHFRFCFGIIHIFFSLYALLSELFLMMSTLVVKMSSTCLMSESCSLWLKSPKMGANSLPEHYPPPKEKMFCGVIWHNFFGIWAKLKIVLRLSHLYSEDTYSDFGSQSTRFIFWDKRATMRLMFFKCFT